MIKKSKISNTYDYRDENGTLLYQVCRTEPKSFFQRRPDGSGGWILNLDGVRRVLYRLPEILAASKQDWIFITEGEKDANRLYDLGFCATCNSGGTGQWNDDFAQYFKDYLVVILPDCDPPGRRYAKCVANSLCSIAREVRIIELPGLQEKGDISNWLDAGGDCEELLRLVDETKPFRPLSFNLTDAGNAERFAARHGDKMRYCWTWQRWLFFDGCRWNLETGEENANRLAIETARSIVREAEGKTYEQRGPLLKWSYRSENAGRISAALAAARSVEPVGTYAKNFDTDPWLLNCLNGTIDLRKGKLLQHDPSDLITKICPVRYDPKAKFQMWADFLKTATDNDESLVQFLQVAAGYSSCGDTGEEKLFFIHGDTATGKSTFLEAIKATLGDYARTSDFECFLKRKAIRDFSNDIARLRGARLVASIEIDEGKKIAEGLIKVLTGGDTISARFLYQEHFEFLPQFKLWLAANYAPKVRDDDSAIWRRILRVPFDHVIPKNERDPKVKAALKNPEKSGAAIMAWLVEGCLIWQQQGLIVPEVIESSTETYRAEQDPLKDFFEECCEFGTDAFIPVADLRATYDQYCKDNGVRYSLGPKQFNKRFRSKGCEQKTKRCVDELGTERNIRCWEGVTSIRQSNYEAVTERSERQD